MKLKEVMSMEAELATDLEAVRRVKGMLERRLQAKAERQLPAKLRQAQKLREKPTPEPAKRGDKARQALALAVQLARAHKPVTVPAIREMSHGQLSYGGIDSTLRRAGYKPKGGVWTLSKPRAAKRRANGKPTKGDATQTLVAVLKDAGKPMPIGELLASVKAAGTKATPQLIGSAMRQGVLTRTGTKGPDALYGLRS